MRTLAALLLFLFLPGVLPAAAQVPDQLEVPVPLERGTAFDRVVEAFVREGLSIKQTDRDAGVLTSEIANIGNALAKVRVTYRATVFARTDTSSVVLLVGTYPMKTGPTLMGSETEEVRLSANGRGPWGTAWKRLERIAARLREVAAPPAPAPGR
jgi:hypothetical protein